MTKVSEKNKKTLTYGDQLLATRPGVDNYRVGDQLLYDISKTPRLDSHYDVDTIDETLTATVAAGLLQQLPGTGRNGDTYLPTSGGAKPSYVARTASEFAYAQFNGAQSMYHTKPSLWKAKRSHLIIVASISPTNNGTIVTESTQNFYQYFAPLRLGSGANNTKLYPIIQSNNETFFGKNLGGAIIGDDTKKVIRFTEDSGIFSVYINENYLFGCEIADKKSKGFALSTLGAIFSNGSVVDPGTFKLWSKTTLTDDEYVPEVGAALMWKHGLQAALPAWHPYKNAPPLADQRIRLRLPNGPITGAAIGDSLTARSRINSANTNGLKLRNFFTAGQQYMGNRIYMPMVNILANDGENTDSMRARIVADFGSKTFDLFHILCGTNDGGVYKTTMANIMTMINYVCDTLGKFIVISTVIPRAIAETSATARDGYRIVNDWILSLDGTKQGRIIVVDSFKVLATAGDEPIANVYYDNTHWNNYGASAVASAYLAKVGAVTGTNPVDFVKQNYLANSNMTGTGGAVGTNATGTVADGFTVNGSVAGSVTASKTANRRQQIAFTTTGQTATDTATITSAAIAESGNFANGDTLYGVAEIEVVGTPANILGLELFLNLGGTSLQALVEVSGQSGTDYPIAETYMTRGRYTINTQDLPITAGTSKTLTLSLKATGDSSSAKTASLTFIVHSMDFKKR